MTRNNSGVSASPASMQHLIEFTAVTPDGDEVAGVATVTGTDRDIPWSELAKIPGFREGDVLRTDDGAPNPRLLGPGADVPGHPAWCRTHDNECGDGHSVCLGETFEIESDDPIAPVLGASLALTNGEAPRIFPSADGVGDLSIPLDMAREYAALLLSLVELAESGSAVSA